MKPLKHIERLILDFLARHPASLKREIVSGLQITMSTADHYVHRLKAQGRIVADTDRPPRYTAASMPVMKVEGADSALVTAMHAMVSVGMTGESLEDRRKVA
jgi:hypothetical protein